jgi:DNA-binding response OmpR family regulator
MMMESIMHSWTKRNLPFDVVSDNDPVVDQAMDSEESDPDWIVYKLPYGLEVWPDRYQVRWNQEWISLTPTQMRVLVLLADQPGRIWSRKSILHALQGGYS